MRHDLTTNQKAQNLVEYVLIVTVVATAMAVMSTYVFRSIQATQQVIQKGFTD